MRKVIIAPDASPPQSWLDEAQALTQKLHAAQTDEARMAMIEVHQTLWRDARIRDWLLGLFHDKCWYSEAAESVSAIHVDHFRPKASALDLDKQKALGYWWLAFDWRNYRIAGQLINVKKSNLFPLLEGARATPDQSHPLQLEAPLLIDPLSDQVWLISYGADEDACIAVPAAGIEGSDLAQAMHSIEILGLNRLTQLNRKRARTWRKCLELIAQYKSAQSPGTPIVLTRVVQAQAISQLRNMTRYEEEFSSIAQACIRKHAPEAVVAQVYGGGPLMCRTICTSLSV